MWWLLLFLLCIGAKAQEFTEEIEVTLEIELQDGEPHLRSTQSLGTPVFYADFNPMDMFNHKRSLDGAPQLVCSNLDCPTYLTNFMRCTLNGLYNDFTHLPKFNCKLSPPLPPGYSFQAASLTCSPFMANPMLQFLFGTCHATYRLGFPPSASPIPLTPEPTPRPTLPTRSPTHYPTPRPTPPTRAPSRSPTAPTLSPNQQVDIFFFVLFVLLVLALCICMCFRMYRQPAYLSSDPGPIPFAIEEQESPPTPMPIARTVYPSWPPVYEPRPRPPPWEHQEDWKPKPAASAPTPSAVVVPEPGFTSSVVTHDEPSFTHEVTTGDGFSGEVST